MTPTLHRWAWRCVLVGGLFGRLFGGLLVGSAAAAAAAGLPPGLVADGMPPPEQLATLPAEDADAAEREAPVARFLDWHPLRAEMLVLQRRGGSDQLHRLPAPGARPLPLTRGPERVTAAAYEPGQGSFLVFARDQGGDEAFRLYRLDLDGEGAPTLLTPEPGRVAEWAFLPDGRGLVLLRERLNRDAGHGAQAHSSLVWLDPQRPGSARVLATLEGGRYTGLRVSPAGQIVVLATRGGREQRWRFADAHSPGQALGKARRSEEAVADPEFEAPAEAAASDGLWLRQTLGGEFRQLVRLDLASGRLQAALPALQAAWQADLEASAEQAQGERWLALLHNEDGFSALRLWKPGASTAERVPGLEDSLLSTPRWHPRLPLLALQQVSARTPGRIVVWNTETQALQPWAGLLREGEALRWQRIAWTSFDGRRISGLHLAPPARFEGPRPVYISLHGGPSAQARPGHVSGLLRTLVEQGGMHVIQPNVRGSEGFGRTFLQLDNGRRREDAVRDVGALLDWLARQRGMDATRVVVSGGSYGGYLSLAVAAQESARIAGSICRVGIAHFVSFLEHTESYRRDNRRAEYGDERDPAMRAFLHRISPLTQAAAIRKPLFVVHGRNDPRVPYAEADSIVRTVRAQGTPVWFLTGENEGHGFRRSENSRFLNQAVLGFIQRVVAGWPGPTAASGGASAGASAPASPSPAAPSPAAPAPR